MRETNKPPPAQPQSQEKAQPSWRRDRANTQQQATNTQPTPIKQPIIRPPEVKMQPTASKPPPPPPAPAQSAYTPPPPPPPMIPAAPPMSDGKPPQPCKFTSSLPSCTSEELLFIDRNG